MVACASEYSSNCGECGNESLLDTDGAGGVGGGVVVVGCRSSPIVGRVHRAMMKRSLGMRKYHNSMQSLVAVVQPSSQRASLDGDIVVVVAVR